MKVLTIKQPWASLIMLGYKRFEFRSWKTNYRGKLLIHAGQGIDKEKLNEVGLDCISLRVSRDGNVINYIDSDIENAINIQEPNEKYVINIWIDIIGIKENSDEKIKIGGLEGNYFKASITIDDYTFYEICDCEGADLEPLAASITDRDGNIKESICEFDENLMYIDRIYIEKEYRGVGIASFVIESLNEILQYTTELNPNVYILLPKPQEKDEEGKISNMKDEKEEKICMEKLLKLYKKLGFKKIRNTNYMIKKRKNEIFYIN